MKGTLLSIGLVLLLWMSLISLGNYFSILEIEEREDQRRRLSFHSLDGTEQDEEVA